MPTERAKRTLYLVDFSEAWQRAGCPTGYRIEKETSLSRNTIKRYLPFIETIDNQGVNQKRLEKYLKTFRGVEVDNLSGAVADLAVYLGLDLQKDFSKIVTIILEGDEIPEFIPLEGYALNNTTLQGLQTS